METIRRHAPAAPTPACTLTPAAILGPYYFDPKLVRRDITEGKLDGTMLFYKSVLGFEAEPVHELVDPYGLIQSRVLESRDRSVRLPLNATASPRTATARFLANYGGGGVHHIALATDDIFATMAAMRANNDLRHVRRP